MASARSLTTRLVLYPGVASTLEQLTERRRKCAGLTNLPRWLVHPMLVNTSLEGAFELVHTAANKPRPAGVFAVADALGVSLSKRVLLVGDGEGDRGAARASGASFAWASYGYGPGPKEGDLVLRSFSDVLRV